MKVLAKCIAKAWDNGTATFYYPSEEYEIEHDGPLASLRVGRRFVFEFDRTMAGTGCSPALGGFACKSCPQVFDTLNELGNHSYSVHKRLIREEISEEEPVVVEKRGRRKGKTFTCKQCGEVFPNLYSIGQHKKTHQTEIAETVAVPA